MILTKPVIFLDIDGVMNSADHFKGDRGDEWGQRPVGALNAIIRRLRPCDIVICSSWRYFFDDAQMAAHLKRNGVRGAPVIGHTAAHGVEQPRGQCIQQWLDEHPDRQVFVILDDSPEIWQPELKAAHVQTMWDTGLGPEHVEPAVAIIRKQRQQIRAAEHRLAAATTIRKARKARGSVE